MIIKDTSKKLNLPNTYRHFFRYKKIQISTNKQHAFFIRPSTKYQLTPVTGAHTFRFWVVQNKENVLFSASADKFSILKSTHEGMHDLRVDQCRGGFCFETTIVFTKGKYQDASCSTRSIDSNKIVLGCKL